MAVGAMLERKAHFVHLHAEEHARMWPSTAWAGASADGNHESKRAEHRKRLLQRLWHRRRERVRAH